MLFFKHSSALCGVEHKKWHEHFLQSHA